MIHDVHSDNLCKVISCKLCWNCWMTFIKFLSNCNSMWIFELTIKFLHSGLKFKILEFTFENKYFLKWKEFFRGLKTVFIKITPGEYFSSFLTTWNHNTMALFYSFNFIFNSCSTLALHLFVFSILILIFFNFFSLLPFIVMKNKRKSFFIAFFFLWV